MELNKVTLPGIDVGASVAFYRKMGFELIVDEPHYARFKSTVGNATFSVHAVDAVGEPAQAIVYFECSSLDQQVALLKEMGLKFAQEARDEPWLWRDAPRGGAPGNIVCR